MINCELLITPSHDLGYHLTSYSLSFWRQNHLLSWDVHLQQHLKTEYFFIFYFYLLSSIFSNAQFHLYCYIFPFGLIFIFIIFTILSSISILSTVLFLQFVQLFHFVKFLRTDEQRSRVRFAYFRPFFHRNRRCKFTCPQSSCSMK